MYFCFLIYLQIFLLEDYQSMPFDDMLKIIFKRDYGSSDDLDLFLKVGVDMLNLLFCKSFLIFLIV